jgi:hypothetical protein
VHDLRGIKALPDTRPAPVRFPIWAGDIWRVGPHVVACGDLDQGHGLLLLRDYAPAPALTYVDPPWTSGIAQRHRKNAGLPRDVDYPDLLSTVLRACLLAGAPALITQRKDHADTLFTVASRFRQVVLRSWATARHKGADAGIHLLVSRPADLPPPDGVSFDRLPHKLLAATAVAAFSPIGGIVFDPCCGKGETADACVRLDRVFLGMDVVPKRVSLTIARLADATGHTPDRAGTLLASAPATPVAPRRRPTGPESTAPGAASGRRDHPLRPCR